MFATDKGIKPEGLKTKIYNYTMEIGTEYQAFYESQQGKGVELFRVYGGNKPVAYKPDREITIETKHVFGNQWNTSPDQFTSQGLRVFNWYESIVPNQRIRTGHYIDVTPEMIDLCEKTYKCGYCGAEYYGHNNKGLFCSSCLDSEYLQEKDLHLLRLLPVDIKGRHHNREELTEDERAVILPKYIKRQTTGNDSRNVQKLKKQRARIESEFQKKTINAKDEHDGMIWLLDHNVNIDNVIYYGHTGRFCFGWRAPLDQSVKSALLDILVEFPFDYDMK